MAENELQHPALHHLRVTPDIVLELMEGLSEEHAEAKPAEDAYSLAEFLEYLSHREAHEFRAELDAILSGSQSSLPTYDRASLYASGTYTGREPEESIAHWQERRDDALELLDEIPQLDLTPALDTLLREWAAHDLMAIRQVAETVGVLLYARLPLE